MLKKHSSLILALSLCCTLLASPIICLAAHQPDVRALPNAVAAGDTEQTSTVAAGLTNPARAAGKPIKVMTRNLYLGADLTPVLNSTSINPTEDNNLFVNAALAFGRVQATDFPARAKLLAREIDDADPELIGLQEVALWRRGEFGVLDGPATPATIVLYDFLQSLQSELSALGLEYSVVVAQNEFDAEVPSAFFYDLRVTLRDVILAKADIPPHKLVLTNVQAANFLTSFDLQTIAGPITLTRGWVSVDVMLNNKRSFRFINTHLESFDPQLRFFQSFELLLGPANTDLPVVLVGDLNSGPTEPPGPFVAYANLLANGFVDTWVLANPSDPGVTCCNAENLLNPDPLSLPEGRIDHVLARPTARVIRAKIVGIDQDEHTPSGLWPSDHAGVITTLAP
ncbi:hypothetical protein BH18ACI2_BH18ACI2_17760 [soil metagenome]